ncbi:MAG TPA: ribonuclease H-like domain-containing protein [Vicinamibacterales bacterium]|nr:ribonuclease H-like domain-containing protein [Vicinamibacterales bacterium]
MATLDRLREIVRSHRGDTESGGASRPYPPPPSPTAPSVARDTIDHTRAALELGGAVVEHAEGSVIVVDREYTAGMRHGHVPIGGIVSTIRNGQDALQLMARAWPSFAPRAAGPAPSLLFIDLETTGLFSGAGTQAFLVGCAAIDGDAIRIRQFLLPGFEHERAVLNALQSWAADHSAICSYNGRSFDVPLIETRFMFHRVPCPLDGVPHLDMLHAARRLWRQRPITIGPEADDASCTLAVLEKHIAGLHRIGDVPGYEIPSRFFKFVRTGDARPLEAVLEHNRLDLLSLAAVLARAIVLITHGPSAATSAHEAYGLARIYERGGAHENAEAALLQAIDFVRRVGSDPELHAEALRRLAWVRRRGRRPHAAAEAWQELASLPRCAAALRREAKEALAIHHEHRSRNLDAARGHALELLTDPEANAARVRHRLERLERKLARRSMLLPID